MNEEQQEILRENIEDIFISFVNFINGRSKAERVFNNINAMRFNIEHLGDERNE